MNELFSPAALASQVLLQNENNFLYLEIVEIDI